MPDRLYKAVRLDGTDFKTGTVRWAASERRVTRPRTVRHPSSWEAVAGDRSTSLMAFTDPTYLPGAGWPMRLLTLEPVDGCPVIETDDYQRQSVAWRVTGEVPAHLRFGPMGERVAALIEQVSAMTPGQMRQVRPDRSRAQYAAVEAAVNVTRAAASYRYASLQAAGDAAGAAVEAAAWPPPASTWIAARYAAWALVVRDLIGTGAWTQEHYDILTRSLRRVGITVHPDDQEMEQIEQEEMKR